MERIRKYKSHMLWDTKALPYFSSWILFREDSIWIEKLLGDVSYTMAFRLVSLFISLVNMVE